MFCKLLLFTRKFIQHGNQNGQLYADPFEWTELGVKLNTAKEFDGKCHGGCNATSNSKWMLSENMETCSGHPYLQTCTAHNCMYANISTMLEKRRGRKVAEEERK